ncbi:MAG: hypothetical protein ACI4EV_05385 [Lachnospiraceae bacterium]
MHLRKFSKSFLSAALATLLIFTTIALSVLSSNQLSMAASKTSDSENSSMIDSVINLISEKGSSLVKDNLPTVGDFLCARVLDYLGIDYTDSYTKEIREVNTKLAEIQKSLTEIVKNQEKNISQNTMIEFFNAVDVFAGTVYPIYVGYNNLLIEEVNSNYTKEKAWEEESDFYDTYLKNMLFGSSTSTGDLYLQLKSLLEKIVLPNVTTTNLSLMDHYTITYEHLWAFDTQSFAPKREFLEYVSTTVMEGLTLYAFQNACEMKRAKDIQLGIYQSRWKNISEAAKKALQYLQKEIKALEKEEKERNDSNTVLHYSTGKVLSREMYVSKYYSDKSHYTYVSKTNTTRQGNMRFVRVCTLNNSSFVDTIQNEFKQYKKNYNKGDDFTVAEFLQTAGFTCADWNHSIYRQQSMKHEGISISNEYYKFYVSYLAKNGNSVNTANWGYLKYKVFGSPTPCYNSEKSWSYIAFVDKDGVLLGSYDTIYSDNGNTTVDAIYSMISGGSCGMPVVFGKVR